MNPGRRRLSISALLLAAAVSTGAGLTPADASVTGTTGSGTPVDNMRPFLPLNTLIAVDGVWPYGGGADAGGDQMRGEIRLFAGNFEPGGWMFCDGRLLSIGSHTALFSLLGTTYGGDGVTSFALPDLRGRAASEAGARPGLTVRSLGGLFGAESTTLSVSQLPGHTHSVPGSTTGSTGGGQPIETAQPTLPLRYLLSPFGDYSYLSEIRLFAGSGTFDNWHFADGQLLPIAEYDPMFTHLGTLYGGDGGTTFGLPDLRGRVAISDGQGAGLPPWSLGETSGSESVLLSLPKTPGHTHTTAAAATGSAGGGQAISLDQPLLALRYAIALQGFFPSSGSSPITNVPMLGEIRLFASNTLPNGWVSANGQLLAINTNAALFALLGTTYGGDGVTTFALPDLRGRTPIGVGQAPGQSNRILGASAGTSTVTVTVSQLAPHAHAQPPSEISLSGNSVPIASGDLVPSPVDGTAFGDAILGGAAVSRTFQVTNGGLGDLTLSGAPRVALSGSSAFSVVSLPTAVLAPGGSSSFGIQFLPSAAGPATATVTIANDDPDESSYGFAIAGNGVDLSSRHPGAVPVSSAGGTPLTVSKNATAPYLDFAWGASCGSGVTGYALYAGDLGSFSNKYQHGGLCGQLVTSLSSVNPGSGDRFFLVSAVDSVAGDEGSLGRQSDGSEIPPAAAPCRPTADVSTCD